MTVPLALQGTGGTVLVLSQKTGTEIDSLENVYYRIFPGFPLLHSAQIVKVNRQITAHIEYYQSSGGMLNREKVVLSEKWFDQMKIQVDLIPMMPWSWWYIHSGKAREEFNVRQFHGINIPVKIGLVLNDDKKIKGTLISKEPQLTVKELIGKKTISYGSVKSAVLYTHRPVEQNKWYFYGISGTAVAGTYFLTNHTKINDMNEALRYCTVGVVSYMISPWLITWIYDRFPQRMEIPLAP